MLEVAHLCCVVTDSSLILRTQFGRVERFVDNVANDPPSAQPVACCLGNERLGRLFAADVFDPSFTGRSVSGDEVIIEFISWLYKYVARVNIEVGRQFDAGDVRRQIRHVNTWSIHSRCMIAWRSTVSVDRIESKRTCNHFSSLSNGHVRSGNRMLQIVQDDAIDGIVAETKQSRSRGLSGWQKHITLQTAQESFHR